MKSERKKYGQIFFLSFFCLLFTSLSYGQSDVFTYQDRLLLEHSNKTALDSVSGINTGDQDLSGYSLTTHDHDLDYLGITGKAADSELLDGYDSLDFLAPYTVYVYSVDDLPTAVGGVITLADDTFYHFGADAIPLTISDDIVIGRATILLNPTITTSGTITFSAGGSIENGNLIYTGNGTFINALNTIPGSAILIVGTRITVNNGTYFNIASTQPAFLILETIALHGSNNLLGNISVISPSFRGVSVRYAGQMSSGFVFTDNLVTSIDTVEIPNGFNTPTTAFTITGTSQGSIQLEKVVINNTASGIYAYKFDMTTIFTQTVSNHGGEISDKDKPFAVNSYTQDTPKFTFTSVGNIPDTNQLLFVGIDRKTPISAADITLDYDSRILTITPPRGYFYFYTNGSGITTKYTKVGSISFPAFPDVTGRYRLFFDSNGEPQYTTTELPSFDTIALIYRILWNATLTGSDKAVVEIYTPYENSTSWVDRDWKNVYGVANKTNTAVLAATPALGTPASSGVNTCIGLTDITNIDANLEYTIENSTGGGLWQQDLGETTPASITTTNGAILDIPYMSDGILPSRIAGTRFPFAWDMATNRPEYITQSGVRTLISASNYYFVYFIFSLQDPRPGKSVLSVSSGAEYATLTDAKAVSWEYMQSVYPLVADLSVRPLYRLIYNYKSNYDPAVKYSMLVETQDLRKAAITQTTATGSLPASSVTFIPTGNISKTNVQGALAELDTEKEPANSNIQTHISSTSNPHSVTKTQIGLANVENTALSTWAGSTAITTLGTISTGSFPYANLSGTPSTFTPANHNLIDTTKHPVSGLTAGQFLKATGPTTYAFEAHGLTLNDIGVMTSDYDAGNYKIRAKTFESDVATGTAPFTVASTTVIQNLNADWLDGQHGSYYQPLLTNPVTGTGTTNYIAKFTGTDSIGDSVIYDKDGNIGIGEQNPGAKVEIRYTGDQFKISYTYGVATTFKTDASGNTNFTNTGTLFDFGAKIINAKQITLNNGSLPELYINSIAPFFDFQETGSELFRFVLDGGVAGFRDGSSYGFFEKTLNGIGTGKLVLNKYGGNIVIGGIAVYANNAAAVSGGLPVGALYRTGADPDHVCIVH